jgi:tryptophanyl-tRNA synthetase
MPKPRIVTGYRPTGKLHLGHWFGNLQNMIAMQRDYEAYWFIADWHALTSHWQDTSHVRVYTEEMVLDWCAAGIDPDVSTIYRQSDVPEVAQLALYFNMITPMGWLERVPSYKEQREQITDKDLGNVGFFLYPTLMAADIAITLAEAVPVGEDQAPHLELTREIVRRFNGTWGDYLVEPKALIPKEGARVPGLDGRKMSKSYGNAIFISDTPDEIRTKVMSMVTDPARKLKTDPGNPDICPLHQIHKLVGEPDVIAEFDACCRQAACGCVAHKKKLVEDLTAYLGPFRERREELAAIPGFAWDVLARGASRVRPVAEEVIANCRDRVRIDGPEQAATPAERDADDAEQPF